MPAKRATAAPEPAEVEAAPVKVMSKPEKPESSDLSAEEIHRLYHIPPAGYEKPKFPSSI
jgi:hypothetical protein